LFQEIYIYSRFINQPLDSSIKYKWILKIKKIFIDNKYEQI
jgi:hypothetical protein